MGLFSMVYNLNFHDRMITKRHTSWGSRILAFFLSGHCMIGIGMIFFGSVVNSGQKDMHVGGFIIGTIPI